MADTFFGFDTTNHGDNLLGTDELDCTETEEEEYDALNDETFGTLEDNNTEDWEREHEQLAEIAESSRHLENSLNQLVLDDDEDEDSFPITGKENTWTYNKAGPMGRNGEVIAPNFSDIPLQKLPSQHLYAEIQAKALNTKQPTPIGPITKKICTVEELERGLMTPRPQKPFQNFPPNPQVIHHPLFPAQPLPRIPPGLHPMNLAGPPLRNIPPMGMGAVPNSFPMMLPYPPGLGPPGQMHGHRMMQHGNTSFPVNHPFNYIKPLPGPLPRGANQQQPQRGVYPPQNQLPPQNQQQQLQQQPRQQINSQQQRPTKPEVVKDEYAGLMTNREKQWLLNIQLLQLNTGTPYFDDYYYTVYKSRNKNKSENKTNHENKSNYYQYQQNNNNNMSNKRGGPNNHHNNSRERHDSTSSGSSILQARVYTPLQFENSLGKLQCGSVTAPRKIIDTDVVTLDNGQDGNYSTTQSKDTRKTKQVLLEIEALYAYLLKMEDLRNPVAITNTEKLRELKQKQRLRELEAAQTPEQKQEVFKLLQKESVPVEEHPNDYLMKLVTGLTQDDKFVAFFSVRKGKGLLLRVLPYLTQDAYSSHLLDLWIKILLSVPIIGRRDAIGDNMLPKLYPFFKRFIQMCRMSDILDIISSISETVKQDQNSRSTPLSHQGKAPLHFIIGNKFGISTTATIIVRTEYLLSSDNATEKQKETWFTFLITLVDVLSTAVNVAHPMEPVPFHILFKHCKRVPGMTPEQIAQLELKIADD